jgi:hypothetical protein
MKTLRNPMATASAWPFAAGFSKMLLMCALIACSEIQSVWATSRFFAPSVLKDFRASIARFNLSLSAISNCTIWSVILSTVHLGGKLL